MTGGCYDVIADCDTVIVAPPMGPCCSAGCSPRSASSVPAYEEIGGFSSGGGRRQTYKRLPNVTWVALSPAHDFRTLDASHGWRDDTDPNAGAGGSVQSAIGSALCGTIGWQFASYLAARDIPPQAMVHVKPSSPGEGGCRAPTTTMRIHLAGDRSWSTSEAPTSIPSYHAAVGSRSMPPSSRICGGLGALASADIGDG